MFEISYCVLKHKLEKIRMSTHHLYYGDNLSILREHVDDESINMIYIDPPFNTGKLQQRTEIQVEQDDQGDRVGFQGKTYRTTKGKSTHYSDKFENSDSYLQFLRPRFEEGLPHSSPTWKFFLSY